MNYRRWSNLFLFFGMSTVVLAIAVPDNVWQGVACGVLASVAFFLGFLRRDAMFGALYEERKEQLKAQDDPKPKT
jgi:hypothetical protein